MSEALALAADAFARRYRGLRGRLPGDAAERDRAAAAFDRLGLPGPRQEMWKYTSLRPLAQVEFAEPVVSATDRPAPLDRVPDFGAPMLVLVDGRVRPDLSGAGMDGHFATRPDFGGPARPDRDSFAALNTMLTEGGGRLAVAPGQDGGTLVLASLATDVHHRPVAFHPRHRVTLGAGARLTLIEVCLGEGVYLHNPLTEIAVGEDARLTHLRIQDESTTAFHVASLYVQVAARGAYDSFLLALGGRLSRTEIHARIGGQEASVQLNAAQLLRGVQHGDFTTTLAHDAPGGRSRQTVRTVLDDDARGVFQGRIEVARIAQKTDGYQMNHALLLSPRAEIDSKPELRINADDVRCSHGATVGELDADQLFYLRSRGIAQAEARAMLIRGFLSESLADIADEAVRAVFGSVADGWWGRHAP